VRRAPGVEMEDVAVKSEPARFVGTRRELAEPKLAAREVDFAQRHGSRRRASDAQPPARDVEHERAALELLLDVALGRIRTRSLRCVGDEKRADDVRLLGPRSSWQAGTGKPSRRTTIDALRDVADLPRSRRRRRAAPSTGGTPGRVSPGPPKRELDGIVPRMPYQRLRRRRQTDHERSCGLGRDMPASYHPAPRMPSL
jgi:hypothetical protein